MKRVLMALGIVMLVIIAAGAVGFGYVVYRAVATADANAGVAIEGVAVLAQSWSPAAADDDLFHSDFATALADPDARQALDQMSELGEFVAARNPEQTNYRVDTGRPTSAVVAFEGTFENGSADVVVTLSEVNEEMKVLHIKLNNVELDTPSSTEA